MEKLRAILALAMLSTLVIIAVPISGLRAQETLIWEADVAAGQYPSPDPPDPVTTPMALEAGREYRIVATGCFLSCDPTLGFVNYVVDAQYYTSEFYGEWSVPNWWIWTSPILASPSVLQIDGMDVDWGAFSNGGVNWWDGHEYTTYYIGIGAPITFSIVDWIDGNYQFNFCHMHVKIYEGPYVPVGETAFAYGGDLATCFLSLGFRNWGWTNGPLEACNDYEFEIWAGASKCDRRKGTLVGTLTVCYHGSTAIVTYNMFADWTMGFAHLYVDGEMLPTKDGEPTVAPGQYPYVDYVDGPTKTFTVTGLSDPIYVVAHADVWGPP